MIIPFNKVQNYEKQFSIFLQSTYMWSTSIDTVNTKFRRGVIAIWVGEGWGDGREL